MASRFWVGGTGTWDATAGTKWALTSGGAGGQTVPTSADDVTFDNGAGASGTVTVNTTVSVLTLSMGAFVGTLDFATNNNDVTIANSSGGSGFNNAGSGTRTLNMGNGTWTFSGADAVFNQNGATNLTFNANGSTIVFPGNGNRNLAGGTRAYNIVTYAASSVASSIVNVSASTIATLNVAAPNVILIGSMTITTFNITGSSSSNLALMYPGGNFTNGNSSLNVTNSFTPSWVVLSNLIFSGGTHTASNAFAIRGVSGITVNQPSGGGAVVGVIGS